MPIIIISSDVIISSAYHKLHIDQVSNCLIHIFLALAILVRMDLQNGVIDGALKKEGKLKKIISNFPFRGGSISSSKSTDNCSLNLIIRSLSAGLVSF